MSPQARRLSEGSSAHVDAVVTRILHVFADALPHVPDHRRLPVLAQLVTTLGPARFLWVLMVLLFKMHATQTTRSASEKVMHVVCITVTERVAAMFKPMCISRMLLWRETWTSGALSAVNLR